MAYGPIPQDTGWSWFCCLGAFLQMMMVMGGMRSLGLLFVVIVERYQANQIIASMIVGLVSVGFAALAPIANGMGVKFTQRKVVMIGGCIAGLSAFLTGFAPNVYYIVVVLGLLTGIGYGTMYAPSLVVLGQYFTKRRALANGFAAAGGSVGQLIIPQMMGILLGYYGFTGALWIYGAFLLHAVPGAALYRPPSFWTGVEGPSIPPLPPGMTRPTGPPPKYSCGGLFVWSHLKDMFFLFFVIAIIFGHGGYMNLCMFLPAYAIETGLSHQQATTLLSVLGVADFFGRIAGGWFADLHKVASNKMVAIGLCCTGIATIGSTFLPNMITLMILAITLGIFGGLYISLAPVVIIEEMGIQKLGSGISLATMLMGVLILPVPISLGVMKEALDSYTYGMLMCGILLIIGAGLMYIAPLMRRFNKEGVGAPPPPPTPVKQAPPTHAIEAGPPAIEAGTTRIIPDDEVDLYNEFKAYKARMAAADRESVL